MQKIDYRQTKTAKKGRDGDKYMAHVMEGEIIAPPFISDDLRQKLYEEMAYYGIDPVEHTVGSEMSINPETGLPEFGVFKSATKLVKKAVKGVGKAVKSVTKSSLGSTLLGIAAPFALGPAGLGLTGAGLLGGSTALGAGLGALSGNGLKGIAGGALGGFGAAGGGGILGKSLGFVGPGASGLGGALLGAGGSAIAGGDLKASILGGGIGGLASLYRSGGFNNVGEAFNKSGLSGALSQFNTNLSGKGDILSATSGAASSAGGGGSSSYGNNSTAGANNMPNRSTLGNVLDNVTSGRGISSILNSGIGTLATNKAADYQIEQQKKALQELSPYMNFQFDAPDLENDPGYQFQLAQGQKAMDRANSARGNYFSGDALRSAGEYATGLADQTYNQAYNRAFQTNQGNLNSVLAKYGIRSDLGQSKADRTINNANLWTDSIANILDPETPEDILAKYLMRV